MMTDHLLWLAFKNATAQEMAEEEKSHSIQGSIPLPKVILLRPVEIRNRGDWPGTFSGLNEKNG